MSEHAEYTLISKIPRTKKIADMPESQSRDPLVWIDLELTGLQSTDTIMEVACFVTDADLNLMDEKGYECTIIHTQAQMEAMDEWCRTHHGDSGLTARCLDHKQSITMEEAADQLLAYVKRFVPETRKALLAGNSVHGDKAAMKRSAFISTIDHLHYRILDVSAIKEAARRWATEEFLADMPQKSYAHTAKSDILESIAEANYYRQKLFRNVK